ncbi:hypothetical protein [Hymenobacter crusticola]|uniref:Bacterial surface antigen (D15) domain-containing protein n=1 Tax=Hymenobacter crusticola TaxID=1770526 RepID=A0A243WBF0_9BACT|nr:hypothetical protein [Hymenobacter crusticola]OUJ72923.1 hypothetical protein BXP70_16630 [Hymenobacter crusticola]
MRFFLGIRGAVGAVVSLLLLVAFLPANAQTSFSTQTQLPRPLLRDLALRLDTTRYTLSQNTITVQGEPNLYFYYQKEDETAELQIYPTVFQADKPLRLVRSADFQLVDSVTAVDNSYYRAKIRFKELTGARFLQLTFTQASDTASKSLRTQSVSLLPITRTTVELRVNDPDLYIGEEKVFELRSNNPINVRTAPEWTRGQDIDYRITQEKGQLRLHVLPNSLGSRVLTARPQTERPFLTDNNRRLSYALPPLRQEFNVKASRLRFLNVDKKEVTIDENARRRGVEIILDNGRSFELKRTYRVEEQEEAGGALIAEIFTRQYLTNDRVLCWVRVYNTHRLTDSYLYIKENDQPKYITNFTIAPQTAIKTVSVRHRGSDWSTNTSVSPGETVDVRLEGESLARARFHFEDVQVIPSDSSIRTDAAAVYRIQVPITIDKRRITIYNGGQPTGQSLAVREFQRPHPLDFVSVTFGESPRPVTRLNGPVLYARTISDVVFSFNTAGIDSDKQLYGKQYLSFDIRTQNAKGELIEMRTVDNIVVCPDESSVRAAFYQDKQCQVGNISLNNLLSARKTYALDDWSTIIVTVRHNQAQYQEPGFTQKLELVLQRRVKFDIDISFPGGLLTKYKGESSFTSFGGISLATLAQLSFYHPTKINKLRPYKVGAGFVALNAFNLSQDGNVGRDLGIVVLGSVYPTRSDAKLTFPLYLGGGYLMNKRAPFFLFGPGIGIRL